MLKRNPDATKLLGYHDATPLHAACKSSNIDIVKTLVCHGADVKAVYVSNIELSQ